MIETRKRADRFFQRSSPLSALKEEFQQRRARAQENPLNGIDTTIQMLLEDFHSDGDTTAGIAAPVQIQLPDGSVGTRKGVIWQVEEEKGKILWLTQHPSQQVVLQISHVYPDSSYGRMSFAVLSQQVDLTSSVYGIGTRREDVPHLPLFDKALLATEAAEPIPLVLA